MPLTIKPLFILANVEKYRPRVHYYDGLASIIAFIKKHGYDSELFQITKPVTKEHFKLYIKKTNPSLVCISANSIQWDVARKFPQWVKECGNIPVVVGGLHSTICPEEVMEDVNTDIACIGEGEYPVLEILNRLKHNQDYSDINNLWVRRENGDLVKNPLGKLIDDLDSLPFPDRDAFGFPQYLYQTDYTLPLISERGCPYNCSFCNNQILKDIFKGCGNYIRRKSPEYVIDEIKYLVEKYPVKRFFFWDDDFLLEQGWVKKFCSLYHMNFKIPFGFMTRVDRAEQHILEILSKVGCQWIYYGVETGDQWLRNKILNKKISNSQIINAFSITKREGIKPYALFMINLPFETPAMVEKTSDLMKEINPYYSSLSTYFHLPKTQLYELSRVETTSRRIELGSWQKSTLGIDNGDVDYSRLHVLNQLLCAKENNHGFFSFAEYYLEKGEKSAPVHISLAEHWRLALEYLPCLVFSSSSTLAFETKLKNKTKMEFSIGYYIIEDQIKPDGEIIFSANILISGKKQNLYEKIIKLNNDGNDFLWYTNEKIDLELFGAEKVTIELNVMRDGLSQDLETFWMNPVLSNITHSKIHPVKM